MCIFTFYYNICFAAGLLNVSKAPTKQQSYSSTSLGLVQISDLAYQQQVALRKQEVKARSERYQKAEKARLEWDQKA